MAKKMFYSMGEVAEMFDVKPSLLRHWEAKFDILRPHKNKKGNRMFTPEDVENLKLIYHLVKERGMTLAGAAQYLKNGITDTMRRDMELLDRLQKIRAELVEVREQLKDVPDGYTVVEVAQPEEEIVIEEPTEEVAPEVIEEVIEPIDDEEDEV
ncbi:MAG: MerR family transcriptional regulator, partial [Rikenellaceae bacterium]|nr:MerR family transcriptional regulator [Rikenellaceae bacterium]